jgi:hypothetical protein
MSETTTDELDALTIKLRSSSRRFLGVIFQPQLKKPDLFMRNLCFLGLFLLGGFLWWYILNGGSFRLDLHDWAEVTAHRYAFLKDAAEKGIFPLHTPGKWSLRNVTDRFWSVADTPLSPQFLLLRWIELGDFILVNTIFQYVVGFIGLLLLQKRFHFSLFTFTIGFFLLFFNGHIGANIVVGHANWSTHMLLPWFVLAIMDIVEGKPLWRTVAFTSVILLVYFLQGAFHLFVACWLFIGLLSIALHKNPQTPVAILVFSLLLSMVRILPPLLEWGKFDTAFLSGFPSSADIVTALTNLVEPIREKVFNFSAVNPLGWWEFDYYVGAIGLLFLLFFGLYSPLRKRSRSSKYQALYLPIIGLTVLSIGQVYKIFHVLHIPFLSSQRVSSRLFILPLVFITFLSLVNFEEFNSRRELSRSWVVVLLSSAVLLSQDLWQHIKLWRITNMEGLFPPRELDLSLDVVANYPDPQYLFMLIAGLCISVFSLLVIILKTRQETLSRIRAS